MLERLNQLEINMTELEKFQTKYAIDEIKADLQIQWILRYGIFESIQIVIDISCHLVTKFNLGNPKTYAECIELLIKENYLNKKVGGILFGMIGLRNLLIHEYVAIDVERLYSLLNNLEDFKRFAIEVKDIV